MKVIFLLLHKLWIVVAILSIYVIINIELLPDTYRCTIDNKAKEINAILLTLSYSFLASTLFYILNVWMPDYYSRKINKKLISKTNGLYLVCVCVSSEIRRIYEENR